MDDGGDALPRQLYIQTLGGLGIWLADEPVKLTGKAAAPLVYLVCERHGHPRKSLAAFFW
jgi:hypothetical protein